MRVRFLFATCLTFVVTFASNPAKAQDDSAAPKDEVLSRFVGVWDLKSTFKPAKWNPDGGETTGKESTVWALKNHIIMIRDVSSPEGKKGLYISTHDAQQDAYSFWCFDSFGLPGTQWQIKWNAQSGGTTARSTDSPPAWTSGGHHRFPDANTILNGFWMRDENGELLMEVDSRKDRLSADREAAILAAWKKHEPPADLPPELKVLDRMIGTWDTVSIQKPAEWTPSGGRSTATVTREWILNGRFVMDSSIHSDGQESIALIGYDPNQKAYRSWWFNSEGLHNTSHGQWDDGAQTLSHRSELDDGKTMNSSVRFAGPNHEVWQFKVTDATGKVYFDMDIIATRAKEAASRNTTSE